MSRFADTPSEFRAIHDDAESIDAPGIPAHNVIGEIR
jgi:hypothetical protein